MCGIVGIVQYGNRDTVSFDVLHDMTKTLVHRGPDEEGYYISPDGRCGLGHRRLAIIDLNGGQQPMHSANGQMHIAFNGEIYNFKELRAELESRGRRFTSHSDTEVILQLFEEYGSKAFLRLNGIFAVAIYDERTQTLVVARDRFGVKPLYYADVDGCLMVASEIKAILASELVSREIDIAAIDTFLDYRFNPAPQTLFKNIRKVPAGHVLSIRTGGLVKVIPLPEEEVSTNLSINETDAREEYTRLLEAAIERQMVSDVPVGLLLSGGIDSALIGSIMTRSHSDVQSYSIGFEGEGEFNELSDARESARILGTRHNEMTISREDYLHFFERSFYYLEEPVAMSTVPAMFYVSQLAARDLKVVLAGQGADEPMAGYPRYRGEKFISDYGWILNKLPVETIARILPRNEKVKRLLFAVKHNSDQDRFHAIHTIFQPELKKRLLKSEMHDMLRDQSKQFVERLYEYTGSLHDSLSKMLYIDTRLQLPDNLLLFNDKMSMANSLEMRVPFLDHELISFLESLPSTLKINGGVQKYLHKKAAEKLLPSAIVHRKKRGFATPIDTWLQRDLVKPMQRLFNERDSAVRQYFNMHTINQMILLHQTRRENYQRHLFALLSFELWHRNFFTEVRHPLQADSGVFALMQS